MFNADFIVYLWIFKNKTAKHLCQQMLGWKLIVTPWLRNCVYCMPGRSAISAWVTGYNTNWAEQNRTETLLNVYIVKQHTHTQNITHKVTKAYLYNNNTKQRTIWELLNPSHSSLVTCPHESSGTWHHVYDMQYVFKLQYSTCLYVRRYTI